MRRGDRALLLDLKAVRYLLRRHEVRVALNNLAARRITDVPPEERNVLWAAWLDDSGRAAFTHAFIAAARG